MLWAQWVLLVLSDKLDTPSSARARRIYFLISTVLLACAGSFDLIFGWPS